MASISEVGHAKNIANLNLLITHITELGSVYQPANRKIDLANLQNIYNQAFAEQQTVNNLVAPYSVAVDARQELFEPLRRQLSKLRKAYKATDGVTTVQLEDLMTIIRKLKGDRKKKKTNDTTDSLEAEVNHSISQVSYDQRTNNMDLLISLLQNTPNYNPNETEYKIETFQATKTQMLQATQAVASTFVSLNNARNARNLTLYNSEDSLITLANKAKDYLFTILDADSIQYKAIARIKFRNR